MYAPKNRRSNYVRQKLIELQGEMDESIIIVGDFNTLPAEMDTSIRQQISKALGELNNTISQLDIIDIHRLLHLMTAEYTFFSSSHRTFTMIDYILGHNTYLSKFKTTEIRSAWVTELVEHLTLGFGSSHDLRVVRLSPT